MNNSCSYAMMNLVNRIRDLSHANPEAIALFENRYGQEFEDVLSEINMDSSQFLSLNKYSYNNTNNNLAKVLSSFPPETLAEEFGEEIFFWTRMNVPNKILQELNTFLSKTTDKNEYFSRSVNAVKEILDSDDFILALAVNDLLHYVAAGLSGSFDLASSLRNRSKGIKPWSDAKLDRYSLTALIPEKDCSDGFEATWGRDATTQSGGEGAIFGNKLYKVYLDTPIAVGLMYNGEPNAIVTMLPNKEDDALMIHQLQGVRPDIVDENREFVKKGSSKGIGPIDWQGVMVDIAEHVAKEMNYSDIGIVSGYNNRWTKYSHKVTVKRKLLRGNKTVYRPKLHLKRAKSMYDYVAKRLGFEREGTRLEHMKRLFWSYIIETPQLNWYKPVQSLTL